MQFPKWFVGEVKWNPEGAAEGGAAPIVQTQQAAPAPTQAMSVPIQPSTSNEPKAPRPDINKIIESFKSRTAPQTPAQSQAGDPATFEDALINDTPATQQQAPAQTQQAPVQTQTAAPAMDPALSAALDALETFEGLTSTQSAPAATQAAPAQGEVGGIDPFPKIKDPVLKNLFLEGKYAEATAYVQNAMLQAAGTNVSTPAQPAAPAEVPIEQRIETLANQKAYSYFEGKALAENLPIGAYGTAPVSQIIKAAFEGKPVLYAVPSNATPEVKAQYEVANRRILETVRDIRNESYNRGMVAAQGELFRELSQPKPQPKQETAQSGDFASEFSNRYFQIAQDPAYAPLQLHTEETQNKVVVEFTKARAANPNMPVNKLLATAIRAIAPSATNVASATKPVDGGATSAQTTVPRTHAPGGGNMTGMAQVNAVTKDPYKIDAPSREAASKMIVQRAMELHQQKHQPR